MVKEEIKKIEKFKVEYPEHYDNWTQKIIKNMSRKELEKIALLKLVKEFYWNTDELPF